MVMLSITGPASWPESVNLNADQQFSSAVCATGRLVLSPTWLMLDLCGAGHTKQPWVRTVILTQV